MRIGKEVLGHFDQLTREIELAIDVFPEELWVQQSENMLNIPCFLAHHTVWCMVLEHLFRIPVERLPHNIYPDYGPDKLLSKQQVLDLLNDIRDYYRDVYDKMSNEEYLEEDEKGMTPLGRVMYALGHTRHHYGELVQILRDNKLDVPMWYPIRED